MPHPPAFPRYPAQPHRTGRARLLIDGRDVYVDGPWGSDQSLADFAHAIHKANSGPARFNGAAVGYRGGLAVSLGDAAALQAVGTADRAGR